MPADPRFFAHAGPQRLDTILATCGASSTGDPGRCFDGVAPLNEAGPAEVSFLDNSRYFAALAETRAGAVVLQPEMASRVPAGCLPVLSPVPYLAFARIAALFHPPPPVQPGIHSTAVVAPDAVLGEGVEIGPCAVVGARAELGAGCVLGPHAVVGDGVVLGEGCRLHAHSGISHAICGARVVLHPGARVGQEGFGFTPTPEGGFETLPQLGRVLLGDGVEIGANSCVDRGSHGDTVLGPGTRVDNLVQVAHNVRLGRGCVMVAQSGISGSTVVGDHVQIGGQAGIAGHLRVGAGAKVAAQSGVMRDVPPGGEVVGFPALPAKEAFRGYAAVRLLAARTRGGKGESG
jgi:UDP-3-O-[3-hydroxymyristoyl] glucosamine N-acyltransferase